MGKFIGKIGYCDNKYLGINKKGGHYVYIRSIDKNGCSVNTITSLEDKNRNFDFKKLAHVKKGNTYVIPYYDANFSLWSGITHKPIKNVPLSEIKYIGKKRIKRRHHWFIGKYLNK